MQGHAVRQNARRPHSDNGTNAAIRGPRHDRLAQLAATLNSRQRPVVQRVVMVGGAQVTEADTAIINGWLQSLTNAGARDYTKLQLETWSRGSKPRNYGNVNALLAQLNEVYKTAIASEQSGAASASAASASATATSPVPTTATQDPLRAMVSPVSMDKWSRGDPNLLGAHHKFPKGALGWLHSKMSAGQKAVLNKELRLPRNAGALDLARLPSNLIAPNAAIGDHVMLKGFVLPELRTDDPDHTPGLGSLDLVHDTDGNMTPRSAEFEHLATNVVPKIWAAAQASQSRYKMSNEHARQVTEHLLRAEQLHAAIEGPNASLPSHHSGDAFEMVDGKMVDEKGSFRKKPVTPLDRALFTGYLPKAATADAASQQDRSGEATQTSAPGGGAASTVPKKSTNTLDDVD